MTAVRDAVQRAIPFVPMADLAVGVTSTGYHAEVAVTVSYHGPAISSLPFGMPRAYACSQNADMVQPE